MERREAWAAQPRDARTLLHAVDVAVADAEDDLDVVLLQPDLLDRGLAATARFFALRSEVRRLVAAAPDSWTSLAAAEDLERTWRALRADARQAGLTSRPWRERRRIRRARGLLERAQGDRGSPAMRLDALRRGLRLLDGAVVLPDLLRRRLQETAAEPGPLRVPGPDFPTYG